MHYQTCRNLWAKITAFIRPAGDVGHGQQRLRLILGLGLLLALWFAFVPRDVLHFRFCGGADADGIPVLVAKQYIASFKVVKEEAVEVRRFPRAFVPPGALNSLSELQNEQGQSTYASVVAIPEGQPLTRTVLIEAGQQQRLASLLRMGRVAVSFDVEKPRAAGGWIQPGDTIAIFQSLPLSSSARETQKATKLLFSAVQVLAVDAMRVGQSPTEDPNADKNALLENATGEPATGHIVTVLATPTEAAALVEAREKGALSIVLRALGDDLPWPGDPVLSASHKG
jgi:Flp pilus assembly protein CpaB